MQTQPPSNAPKHIPFKEIRPIKYLGISSTLPFNSLISDSKLIYFSGRSIILENIKTYEQKPIWTNEFDQHPQVIQHFINIHRQNIVGIALRDPSQTHLIIIMNINSQINNYEHLNKKQKQKHRLHYLKTLPGESTTVQKLKFLHEGSLFAVVVSVNDHKDTNPKSIFIHSSMSGELLHNCSFVSHAPLVEGLQLNRQSYICIIKNTAEEIPKDSLLQSKKSFHNLRKLPASNSMNQQQSVSFFNVMLINSSQLNSKKEFLVELNSGEFIMEVQFFQNHKKTFAFLLLNSGFLLIYMINERGFHDVIRVDVRISKEEHIQRMKDERKNKTIPTQKGEQDDQQKSTSPNHPQKQHSETDAIGRLIQESVNFNGSDSQDENKFKDNSLNVPSSKQRLSTAKSVSSTSSPSFYMPTCICCTNCKVVIGYENCSFIGLLTYSAVDHRQNRFKYISDFFSHKPDIQSIHQLKFSEDGCHCSVLVKVDPNNASALRKKRKNLKAQKNLPRNNQNHEEIIQNQQNNSEKGQHKLIHAFKNKSHKHPNPNGNLSPKGLNRMQKRAKILTPKIEEFAEGGLAKKDLEQDERQHFAIMHIDFISGMIEHEYHSECIEESLTSTSLNGTVELVEFNHMNNTMLVLMNDNRLFYYHLNPTNLHSDKELLNCGRSNVNELRKKLESNGFFGQKYINNYLAPDSVLLWVDKVKTKPGLILCHPFMYEMVLIFKDNLKFHFYNYDKMFDFHHVINLKNCKAASYSPFGDKLALGTVGSIWLVDSYTRMVLKKISLVIFPSEVKSFSKQDTRMPTKKSRQRKSRQSESVFISLSSKTVSRIQYINNNDIMIQTGSTTLSMLLNYEKVIYYGSTLEAIQGQLLSYDYKHRLTVIASDTTVKVVTKCSINSKNKCEELAKIDLAITAVRLCGDIDILFLGSANGVLHFIRWPEFFQNDTLKTPNINNKLHLFHCPIVDIQISVNYRHLFVTSKEGNVVICELFHSDEVEKIGKDVSYVMSKKIDLPLPLVNKWLVSSSDEEKKAQNITKLMGNEAQIKNSEAVMSQEYRTKLQKLSQIQKQQLEEHLKNQIRQYEEESGISKLQQQNVALKDQIKRVTGKRELQTKKVNEEINEDLHKVFLERQKLEKELKELTHQTSKQKAELLAKNLNDQSGYQHLTEMQLQQDETNNRKTQQMFEKKMKIDRTLEENMIEDFMDQRYEFQKLYTQELADVYLKNNELNSLNRNKNVQISLINDKMRELATRMYELQNDCKQLEKQNQKVTVSKKILTLQILQTDKKYHALIKKTKEMEITLKKTRTYSEACQLKFDDLEKQMELLRERWCFLEKKREQSEIDFVEQFKLKNFNSSQIEDLKLKIQKLKAKRKLFFENNVLLKGLIKPYEKEFNATNFSTSTDPEVIACIDSSTVEVKKIKTNKLTSDVDKWNTVKNDNKAKCIRYNEKMLQENNKLVYRFNELQKQFKELVNIQKHMKTQITVQKQKESMNSTKWEKFSFVHKGQKEEDDTNKNSSLLIHSPCDTKENLWMTSFAFSCQNSLHREAPSIDNLKKAGVMPKSMLRESETNELNKKGSKNLQALIHEKRQLFKQRRQNDHSRYHGVALDRATLKPKKTMCLSLHYDGEGSGKFVTQY